MKSATIAPQKNKFVTEWLPSIILVLLLLVARSTLADHYHVPTGSMEQTLIPGDHVLVNKAAYGLRIPFTMQVWALAQDPIAGEVVVFDSPENDIRLIKRVVAVGGDHVVLRNGKLIINGQPLSSSNLPDMEQFGDRMVELNLRHGGGPDIRGMTIPEGHILVLGDHRGSSHDGRYFGTIPVEEVYGRASAVFWRRNSGPLWQGL